MVSPGFFFANLIFMVTMYFLLREMLIIAGVLKGPILYMYQKYGDQEEFYFVVPRLMFWLGSFLITSSIWGVYFMSSVSVLVITGFILISFAVYINNYFYSLPEAQQLKWLFYPRWQHELIQRTTRLERRRIGYMWLHITPNLRRVYSGNTRAFWEWADFVIIATLM